MWGDAHPLTAPGAQPLSKGDIGPRPEAKVRIRLGDLHLGGQSAQEGQRLPRRTVVDDSDRHRMSLSGKAAMLAADNSGWLR